MGVRGIAGSLGGVADSAGRTRSGVVQAEQAAQELVRVADDLRSRVGQLRVLTGRS